MNVAECKEIFALLSQYLDAELPPDMCASVEAHLGDCPPCVEFVQTLEKTVGLCRKLKARQSPDPLPPAARAELLSAYGRMLARKGRV